MNAQVVCPTCRKALQLPPIPPGQIIACPICLYQWCPNPLPSAPPPLSLDEDESPFTPLPRRKSTGSRPSRATHEEPFSLDEPRRGKGSGAALIIVGFLVLLGAGIGVGWFLTRDKEKPNKPEVVQTATNTPSASTGESTKPATPATVVAVVTEKKTGTPPKLPPITTAKTAALNREQIYQRLLKSTVFIFYEGRGPRGFFRSSGSGALVNKEHGLIVTNYHVINHTVEGQGTLTVFFPAFNERQELITEPSYYINNVNRLGLKAQVLTRDPEHDLAAVEVTSVPDSVQAIPFAAKPANPGEDVFSIGASGVKLQDLTGSLWLVSTGNVRGRYRDTLHFRDGQSVTAMLLATQKPVNPGDSGGPTCNDRGELVALVSSGDTRKDLVKHDIDLTEIRDFLRNHATRNRWSWTDPPGAVNESISDPAVIESLTSVMRDGEPNDRVTAVRRLGDLGGAAQAAVPALLSQIETATGELSDAIVSALARIGPPPLGSEPMLTRALKSKSEAARAYAARTLAEASSLPIDVLKLLAQSADDPSTVVRSASLRALAKAGPLARPIAFSAVINRTTDSDTEVRKAAQAVLASYQPFTDEDRPYLVKFVTHADPDMRASAAGWVAPLITDAREAARLFQPLLRDTEASVRLAGLRALIKLPASLTTVAADVIRLMDDPATAVSLAALATVAHIKDQPGIADRAAAVYQRATEPDLRTAATAALVHTVEGRTDRLPLLRDLYKQGSTVTRTVCLDRYQTMLAVSVDVEPDVIEATKDADATVREKAFQVISTSESLARKSIPFMEAAIAKSDETEPVRLAAIKAMANCGPEGIDPLIKLALRDFSPTVNLELCKLYAKLGAPSIRVQPWLLAQADLSDEARAVLRPLFADHANADTVKELLERTSYYKASKPGQTRPERYPDDIRKWAVGVLGEIKYVQLRLSDQAVKTRLKSLQDKKDDTAVNNLAKTALLNIARGQ